jgi:phosphohistidine phosphatase
MDLYIIRHAEAEPAGFGLEDAHRPLTKKGRESFARGVHGLERLAITFDRIYHSPLLRAVETADLLVPLLDGRDGARGETCVTDELARAPRQELLAELEGERVALVGHEPHVSDLVALLVIGWRVFEPAAHCGIIDFKKGAVAWLSGEPREGEMTLAAFWPPKTLRRIGKK